MSIIVGVMKENKICIAGDTQTSRGSTKVLSNHIVDNDKILEVGDSYLGFVGWYAIATIIEHLIGANPEIFKFDSRLNIFGSLLAIQDILKERYFIKTDEYDDQPVESNQIRGIIINKTGLYEISSTRTVRQFNDFCAIGSGYRLALGAMNALYDKTFNAEEIAIEGVKAAAEFDDSCSLPHTLYTITL